MSFSYLVLIGRLILIHKPENRCHSGFPAITNLQHLADGLIDRVLIIDVAVGQIAYRMLIRDIRSHAQVFDRRIVDPAGQRTRELESL